MDFTYFKIINTQHKLKKRLNKEKSKNVIKKILHWKMVEQIKKNQKKDLIN